MRDETLQCDYCLSKLVKHPDPRTLSEGGSGFEYICPNCGAGWNVLRH